MSAKNIIRTYKLEDRIRALKHQEGLTDLQIADRLNKEDLVGKETISQPTVSRWIKKDVEFNSRMLSTIRREYREQEFSKDMEIINERIQYNYMICKSDIVFKDNSNKVVVTSNVTINEKRIAERETREWLKLKAQYCGLDSTQPGGEMASSDTIDLSAYRLDHKSKTEDEDISYDEAQN